MADEVQTQAPVVDTDSMSLEELVAAANAEATAAKGESLADFDNSADEKQPRDANGKFVKADDTKVVEADDEEEEGTGEPDGIIYRREIDLGDGTGVQVFQSETLEGLVDKLADAQRNATKKIHELNKQVKSQNTKTAQEIADDEYVLSQEMLTKPRETVQKLVAEEQRKIAEENARVVAVQENFLATHPSYVANPENGKRIVQWLQLNGHAQLTEDGLEKAYQDLSTSGLLKLKVEEADDATDTKGKGTERIVQTKPDVTQQRSSKKSSTISTTRRATTQVVTAPSEDELYDESKYSLEQLRELSNKELAKRHSAE